MDFRDLQEGDLDTFADFVSAIYEDVPQAMWFSGHPSTDELKDLLQQKLEGMEEKKLVDLVAVQDDEIIAECEIVKTVANYGYLGLLVKKEYRRQGIATKILALAQDKAKEIGVRLIQAEVSEDNESSLNFMSRLGFVTKKTQKNVEYSEKTFNLILLEKKI